MTTTERTRPVRRWGRVWVVPAVLLWLLAGMLIWSKLKLVGGVPTQAYADDPASSGSEKPE